MKFSRTIAGAGAALTLATAAQAADAVMAPEAEPVEYVRICDLYGKGFFYIPGTETCIRVSGYVRYQIGASNDSGTVTETPNYNGFGNGWDKNVRARVNFDARSETEWGTLRSFIRMQASWNGVGDGAVRADQAWISLGGLRMGYSESAWADTVVGLNTQGSHSDNGLSYGDQQRALIQYNFKSESGLFAVLSVEDDALDGDGYVPDVVGVLGYEAGWGGLWARLGYDESYNILGDGGFGASAGLQINTPGSDGSSFRVVGYYADADHSYGSFSPYAAVTGGNGNAEWSVLASYYHQLTSNFGASVGGQYFSDFYNGGSDVSSGIDGYSAEVSLVWVPVKDFEVRSELQYDKVDTRDGSVSGYLRFTRFF